MKLQYLGDVHDAFKYDLLHWLCTRSQPRYERLLIVPMLTSDDPAPRDGRKPHSQFPCQPRIRSFLEGLATGARDLRRMAELGRIDPADSFDAEVFAPERILSNGSGRSQYWQGLPVEGSSNALVFLDPDNGFEGTSTRSDKHVLHAEARSILEGLDERSSLVVYQHRPRQTWSDAFSGLRSTLDYAPYVLAVHSGQLAYVILSVSGAEHERLHAAASAYVLEHPKVELTLIRRPDEVVSRTNPAPAPAGTRGAHIFLESPAGDLVRLAEEGYETEGRLQDLLARYPSLLPGDQVDPESPRRWLLVDRELGIPDQADGGDRWAIDHLFLDQDAVPTLVEVKRSTDGRIRREVLGQMLDYAANGPLYWPVDRLRSDFEAGCVARGQDPATEIADLLGRSDGEDEYWAQVQDNLNAGRVRLVFVADKIPSELLRVVEFLNQQMDPAEVLALEIRQFLGEGRRILVPRLLGSSVTTRDRKQGTAQRRSAWTADELLTRLRERGEPHLTEMARVIMQWGKERGCTFKGGDGPKNPSVYLQWATPAGPRKPLSLYLREAGLELYVEFAELGPEFEPGATARLRLSEGLGALSGRKLQADKASQGIQLGKLAEPNKQRALMDVLQYALNLSSLSVADRPQ